MARCWTNETAILVGEELSEELPPNLYHEYYQPDYKLNRNVLSGRQLDNQNMRSQVDAIRIAAMEHLRHLSHTPGTAVAIYLLARNLCGRSMHECSAKQRITQIQHQTTSGSHCEKI